jgi:hypothetical protein
MTHLLELNASGLDRLKADGEADGQKKAIFSALAKWLKRPGSFPHKGSRSYRAGPGAAAVRTVTAMTRIGVRYQSRFLVLTVALALAPLNSHAGNVCSSECMTVNQGGPMIYGSGKMKTEVRPVGKFDSVRVSVPANVLIERTGAEGLSLTADDNLLPILESEVSDGTLQLSVAKGTSFAGRTPIIRITVADLRKLDVEGSGAVKASKLDGSALSLTVSGSGNIRLAGTSDNLAVVVDGSGSVAAAELQSKRAKVVVRGSGEATVNARDELDATIMGSGSVDYLGSPKLASSVFGSGSINQK